MLLLPPNVVCHARLALAVAAAAAGAGAVAVTLFAASALLDCLGQQTAFGAFYDVAVDNLTRALLWCGAAGGTGLAPWAGLPIALEGITLACTHAGGGAAWKAAGWFRQVSGVC